MHSYKTYPDATSLLGRRTVVLNVGKTLQSLATLKNYTNIFIHISLWALYKFLIYYLHVIKGGVPGQLFWAFTGFETLIEPLIFYSYYYYLIPRYLENKKILTFLILSLLVLGIVPLPAIQYNHWVQSVVLEIPAGLASKTPYPHLEISLNLFVFMTLAIGARFTVDWFRNQRLKTSLEKQNLLSEMALLKSQVNPHFLFNTLNNIYTLSYKQDKNAPEAILKLSELMRYMLYEASDDIVSLEQEIRYICNYIELQRLRLKDPFNVNFMIRGSYQDKIIPPMLLIPFVENAFKHGISLQHPCAIDIELEVRENVLYFNTINNIVNPQRVRNEENDRGIGYKNVQRRLELLYPDRHLLKIHKTIDQYFVNLIIKLKNHD